MPQDIRQPQRLPIPRSVYDSRQIAQRNQPETPQRSTGGVDNAANGFSTNTITGGGNPQWSIGTPGGSPLTARQDMNPVTNFQPAGAIQVNGRPPPVASSGSSVEDGVRRAQAPVLSRGVGPGGVRTANIRQTMNGDTPKDIHNSLNLNNILTDSTFKDQQTNVFGHKIGMAPASNGATSTSTDQQTQGNGQTQPFDPNLHNADGSPKRPGVLPATQENNSGGVGTSSSGLSAATDENGNPVAPADDTGGQGYTEQDRIDGKTSHPNAEEFARTEGVSSDLAGFMLNEMGVDLVLHGDNGYRNIDPTEEQMLAGEYSNPEDGDTHTTDSGGIYEYHDGKWYAMVSDDLNDAENLSHYQQEYDKWRNEEGKTKADREAQEGRDKAEAYIRELMGMEAPSLSQDVINEQLAAARNSSDYERGRATQLAMRMGTDAESLGSQTAGINQGFGVANTQQQAQIKLQAAVQNVQSQLQSYQNRVQSLMALANMTNDATTMERARAAQMELMAFQQQKQQELMIMQQKLSQPNFGEVMANIGGGLLTGLTGGLAGAIFNPLLGGLSSGIQGALTGASSGAAGGAMQSVFGGAAQPGMRSQYLGWR